MTNEEKISLYEACLSRIVQRGWTASKGETAWLMGADAHQALLKTGGPVLVKFNFSECPQPVKINNDPVSSMADALAAVRASRVILDNHEAVLIECHRIMDVPISSGPPPIPPDATNVVSLGVRRAGL